VQVLRQGAPQVRRQGAAPELVGSREGARLLLTQAKGKPAETKTIDLNLFAAQTRGRSSSRCPTTSSR
jgi:hypothetical protein